MKTKSKPTKRSKHVSKPLPKKSKPISDAYIFTYFDGEKERGVDGWALTMQFATDDGDTLGSYERLLKGDPSAALHVIASFRKQLGIKEYDHTTKTGLTALQVLEVAGEFLLFATDVKKNIESNPTLQAVMGASTGGG